MAGAVSAGARDATTAKGAPPTLHTPNRIKPHPVRVAMPIRRSHCEQITPAIQS